MQKTDTHLHLDENTAVPLSWVKVAFLAGLGLIGLVAAGIWWAATLQSNVEHQGEQITVLTAATTSIAEDTDKIGEDVSQIKTVLEIRAKDEAKAKADEEKNVVISAYRVPAERP